MFIFLLLPAWYRCIFLNKNSKVLVSPTKMRTPTFVHKNTWLSFTRLTLCDVVRNFKKIKYPDRILSFPNCHVYITQIIISYKQSFAFNTFNTLYHLKVHCTRIIGTKFYFIIFRQKNDRFGRINTFIERIFKFLF